MNPPPPESRFRVGWLLALWFLLAPGLTRAADTNAVIAAWLATQTNLTTWSADFVQTRLLPGLSLPLVSTGRVWFARPNRCRWELGQPPHTLVVRNEEWLDVTYPRLQRTERYPVSAGQAGPLGGALGLLEAGFPRSRAEFDARFRVTALTSTNRTWLIGLQPWSSAERRLWPTLRVQVRKKTFQLLANEIVFPDGARLRHEFRHATLNAPFPPATFQSAHEAEFELVTPPAPP